MKAFLITIGDEILLGQTLNTNAAYIGEKLADIFIQVGKTSVVPDNEEAILKEFRTAFAEYDLIIVTGGLGPTHDDVTTKCITKFFETELVFNEVVFENIKRLFSAYGREVTAVNRDQALVPKIASPIQNKKGTAPGLLIEKESKIFIAMPGVPAEMKGMMEETILPKLKGLNTESKVTLRGNLLTTGIPESYLYERLGDLDALLGDAKLAFLPSQFGVKMRITVEAENDEICKNKLSEVEQKIRAIVGRYIYSVNEEEPLEVVIARMMIERGLTLSVAESCTGGLICSRLTNISGSSAFFERGFVTYSNGAKVENLKVDEDLIQEYGAVSIQVARQMAEGVRAVSMTDIGLAVTGIMGPTGGTDEKPVGTVFIGICDEKICTAKMFKFGGDRLLNKDRTSQAALDMLRRHLLGISYDE